MGEEEKRKERRWRWGRGGVEGSGRIRKGRASETSRGASEGRRGPPPPKGRPLRAAPVGPPLLAARGSLPGRPPRSSGPAAARKPGPGCRLPEIED